MITVKDVEHVQREVGRIPAGKVVQFTVIRNEKKVNITKKCNYFGLK